MTKGILFAVAMLQLGAAGAGTLTTTFTGTTSAGTPFIPSILKGDPFLFSFEYADTPASTTQFYVNGGVRYYDQAYPITGFTGTGSIYDYEIASRVGGGPMDEISRPLGTLDHREWHYGNIYLISEFVNSAYGSFDYGGPNQIGLLVSSVRTFATPEPAAVPEPSGIASLTTGIAMLMLANSVRVGVRKARRA